MKSAIIFIHALIGWIFCGVIMGIGASLMSLQSTLIVHATGAPLGFAVISYIYFQKFNFTTPLQTAIIFVAIIIFLDTFIVAIVIEKSFNMFTSIPGTWLPFALIFTAVYLTGKFKLQNRRV